MKPLPSRSLFQNPDELRGAIKLIREREERAGPVVIPKTHKCLQCNKYLQAQFFPTVGPTGVIARARDCFCKSCAAEYRKDLDKVARIVCAGCREVIHVMEPGVERTGYTWRPGSFAHVAECPSCTTKTRLRQSPVAEKIAFYKAAGIPYE